MILKSECIYSQWLKQCISGSDCGWSLCCVISLQCSDTVGRQEEHLASKKFVFVRCWWWFDWSFACYSCSCQHSLSAVLAPIKSRIVTFRHRLPGSSCKWPLNERRTMLCPRFVRTVMPFADEVKRDIPRTVNFWGTKVSVRSSYFLWSKVCHTG